MKPNTLIRKWILNNWKAKLVSLLLGIAIWYLIDRELQDQIPPKWDFGG